ncbi:MAG: DUF2490 domain-containing protein [Bacteroidota bacterium]
MKKFTPYKSIYIILLLVATSPVLAQCRRTNDLSWWTWFQVYKDINKKSYVSFQYQLRLNDNMSHYDSNNFYFQLGVNPYKNINLELLYQLNTDYHRDLHTFYLGLTYKVKVKRFSFFFRTAFQHTRDFFTGENRYDQPINEWRNRIKATYSISKNFELSLSAEPTTNLFNHQRIYIEKVRTVAQLTFNYNKYQALNLFYMYQPDIYTTSTLSNKFVLGITYQVNLPSKLKKYKKIFDFNKDLKDFNNAHYNNNL